MSFGENVVTAPSSGKRIARLLVGLLNFCAGFCLIYCMIPYVLHDTTVRNPEAMIPFEAWEAGGFCLTVGTIPLLIANALLFLAMEEDGFKGKMRILYFLPTIICVLVVAHFWITGLFFTAW